MTYATKMGYQLDWASFQKLESQHVQAEHADIQALEGSKPLHHTVLSRSSNTSYMVITHTNMCHNSNRNTHLLQRAPLLEAQGWSEPQHHTVLSCMHVITMLFNTQRLKGGIKQWQH
jgi:hypothetical protein